jgi:hypothetical protein
MVTEVHSVVRDPMLWWYKILVPPIPVHVSGDGHFSESRDASVNEKLIVTIGLF